MNLIPTPHHRGCVRTIPPLRWIAYWMLTGVLVLDCFWFIYRMVNLINQVETHAVFVQTVFDSATWWSIIAFGLGAGMPLACIVFGPYFLERAFTFARQ